MTPEILAGKLFLTIAVLTALDLGGLVLMCAVLLPVAFLMGLRSARDLGAIAYVNFVTGPVITWILAAVVLGTPQVPSWLGTWGVVAVLGGLLAGLCVGAIVVQQRLLTWALHRPARQMLAVSVRTNAAALGVVLVLSGCLIAFSALGLWS